MAEFMEDDALYFRLVEGGGIALVEAFEIERGLGLGGIDDSVLPKLRPVTRFVIGNPDLRFAPIGIAFAGSAHLAEIELDAHGGVVGPGGGDLSDLGIYFIAAAHEAYPELRICRRPLDQLAIDAFGPVR